MAPYSAGKNKRGKSCQSGLTSLRAEHNSGLLIRAVRGYRKILPAKKERLPIRQQLFIVVVCVEHRQTALEQHTSLCEVIYDPIPSFKPFQSLFVVGRYGSLF